MERGGDGARRATGRTGDGGTAGHGDATWHGGAAGDGDATWHGSAAGDGPPRVDVGASLFLRCGDALVLLYGIGAIISMVLFDEIGRLLLFQSDDPKVHPDECSHRTSER